MSARLAGWACAAAIVVGLAGCSPLPQIPVQRLSVLDKGLSPVQTAERLRQPPLSVHRVDTGGRAIEIHRYLLNSGSLIEAYFLAFENGKLLYWGYATEFRRGADKDVNEALSEAMAAPLPGR